MLFRQLKKLYDKYISKSNKINNELIQFYNLKMPDELLLNSNPYHASAHLGSNRRSRPLVLVSLEYRSARA